MVNNYSWNLDYISHHGVIGMHWGVSNGPPYPLGSGLSTGKRLKPAAKGDQGEQTHKALRLGQKRAIVIGAAAVGTVLAAYGIYKLNKSGVLKEIPKYAGAANTVINKHGSEFVKTATEESKVPQKVLEHFGTVNKDDSFSQIVTRVNPDINDPDTQPTNCGELAAAMAIQKNFGVNVVAKGNAPATQNRHWEEVFKGTEAKPVLTPDDRDKDQIFGHDIVHDLAGRLSENQDALVSLRGKQVKTIMTTEGEKRVATGHYLHVSKDNGGRVSVEDPQQIVKGGEDNIFPQLREEGAIYKGMRITPQTGTLEIGGRKVIENRPEQVTRFLDTFMSMFDLYYTSYINVSNSTLTDDIDLLDTYFKRG